MLYRSTNHGFWRLALHALSMAYNVWHSNILTPGRVRVLSTLLQHCFTSVDVVWGYPCKSKYSSTHRKQCLCWPLLHSVCIQPQVLLWPYMAPLPWTCCGDSHVSNPPYKCISCHMITWSWSGVSLFSTPLLRVPRAQDPRSCFCQCFSKNKAVVVQWLFAETYILTQGRS